MKIKSGRDLFDYVIEELYKTGPDGIDPYSDGTVIYNENMDIIGIRLYAFVDSQDFMDFVKRTADKLKLENRYTGAGDLVVYFKSPVY